MNECAQHCEDLFAVLKFLREDLDFAKRMSSYGAGGVTKFGRDLSERSDEEVGRLFFIAYEEGFARLGDTFARSLSGTRSMRTSTSSTSTA